MFLLVGCGEESGNSFGDITMDSFAELRTDKYVISAVAIREQIARLCRQDKDSTAMDFRVRRYYREQKAFLWITRRGIDDRADTLLSYLRTVPDFGFTEAAFGVAEIAEGLERVRALNFDSVHTVNRVLAHLEYLLTKAYLRYATGQRFGYVNPREVLNRLDVSKTDTLGRAVSYQQLFDVTMDTPDNAFYDRAYKIVRQDSLHEFLTAIQPHDKLFDQLCERLREARTPGERMRILCNMERRRWRVECHPQEGSRYVLVNIPAYHLWAYGGDTVLDMRIGCGALKTKTPLLTSSIQRMDVNPKWIIPMSIITNEVAGHAGNPSYFERRRYVITNKSTGAIMDPSEVTPSQLRSGLYRVAQEGGEGNSLGRIIFRFPNNFSVFLHDTSSREVFGRDNRGVSHGCVRVQKPYDLALFLLNDDDEWLHDKLRITMGMSPQTVKGILYCDEHENRKLVTSLAVKPSVPLFITYYTMYPDPSGQWCTYPDVYGYDKVIGRHIKPFME